MHNMYDLPWHNPTRYQNATKILEMFGNVCKKCIFCKGMIEAY